LLFAIVFTTKAQRDYVKKYYPKDEKEITELFKLATSGDSAAFFAKANAYRSRTLARKNYELLCNIYNKYAIYYFYAERYSIAEKYFDSIETLIDTRKLPDYVIYNLTATRAVVRYSQGDFYRALKDYKRGEEFILKHKVGNLGSLYSNMATLYLTAHDYVNGKKYTLKALPFARMNKKDNTYIKLLKSLASTYYHDDDYRRGDSILFMATDLSKKENFRGDYAECLYDYGNTLKGRQKFKEAIPVFEELKNVTRELGDLDYCLQATLEVAKVYYALGNKAQAKKYVLESEKIKPSEVMPLVEQMDVLGNRGIIYNGLGMYKEAADCYTHYVRLDALEKENDNYGKLRQLSNEYDRKQDSLNAAREKKFIELNNVREQEKAESKLQQQRIVIIVSLVGFALVIGFVFSLIRANRAKEKANKEISRQRGLLAEKNKEITDSIVYAQRIQQSLLPPVDLMEILLPKHFLIYQPKDIVSGDFYWIKKLNANELLVAVADCTGHGVPGAMMSALSIQNLNELSGQTRSPGELLSLLNTSLRNTLNQDQEGFSKDGLDICLCKVNIKERKIQYSGANRSILVFNETGLKQEVKATKNGIGGHTSANQVYEEHELTIEENDLILMSTDGFADQFGGKDGRKLTTKRFKKWMTDIVSVPDKKAELTRKFAVWKGLNDQIDDVCVLGFKI
jgi:serine phosphatase RsbU (regulator of sigma subunit)/tetratricopeptide (TPR) repeat protein